MNALVPAKPFNPDEYDFCGGTPYDVQLQTVQMLLAEPRSYVLNGLGCGKTASVLWAFDILKRAGLARKMLVVAKLSTLEVTWQHEIMLRTHHLKFRILHGSKEKRLKGLADMNADIYIINHDGVNTILKELKQRIDIDIVTLDELAVYRNGNTTRRRNMSYLVMSHEATSKTVWGLTGSPLPRSVTDVWGQAKIIKPHSVPSSFKTFRDEMCIKVSDYKWVAKPGATERANEIMKPSVRFSLSDVTELPPVVMQYVHVPLGTEQQRVFDEMQTKCVSIIQNQKVTAVNEGVMLMKLTQIAMGWVYTGKMRKGHPRTNVRLDNQLRIQTIIDYVEATNRKALVFLPFKSALAGVSEDFDAAGVDHAVVSGDTNFKDRSQIFQLFQHTDKYKALVAHPACVAHGLTLTAADVIVWGGPVTSLDYFLQANGRITRIGQKHKQLVVLLGGTQVERNIYAALGRQESGQQHLLDLAQADTFANI